LKEKGFSNFISLLIILALHEVIMSFVFSTGVFLKTSLNREWTSKSRSFQEKSLKETIEKWMEKAYSSDDIDKIFEKVVNRGKDGDFNFETSIEFKKIEELEKEILFSFSALSRTWRGRRESKTILEGELRLFKGKLPLSLFPLLLDSQDSLSRVKIISKFLPKEIFSSSISFYLNLREEVKEKIKNCGEGIFYFDSLEEPALFINQDVEKIEFRKEFDFQVVDFNSKGEEFSLRIGNGGSVFENYDGTLKSPRPCKLVLVNGEIKSILSSEDNVLISGLDLTLISSGPLKIEKSIDGENSLLGICSTGFDILNGEERESSIKISSDVKSIRASLFSAGTIEIERGITLRGSLQAKNLRCENLKIIVQDYLVSGLNPTFYPLTLEDSIFIGKLNIEEWREK
jgi:hypothetical protein